MSCTAFVLLLLPLAANSLGFPTGGGGGCCCGGGAPACASLAPPCASSCGSYGGSSYGGGSSYYGGGGGGGYSQGYAAASTAYAQQPQAVRYVSAPQQSGGGYVQPQAPVPSYSAPVPAPVYSAPSAVGYANSAPAPSYIPPVPAPAPSASAYGSAPPPPPPPPPPSNYAGSGTQYEQVNPSAIQKEGQYNEGTGAAAAAGGRLAVVEDAETAAGAELSAVAANATANEPTPPIDISLLKLTNDTECNSEDLREIIEQNISDDLNTSKRLIQIASEAKFGGRFDVICSQNDFSYLSNTELFCQHAAANQVSCYAYRQL